MKLLEKVISTLPKGIVKDIHLGDHWCAVVSTVDGCENCGLASNPINPQTQERVMSTLSRHDLLKMSTNDLCNLVFQPDLRLASIGIATINSLLSHKDTSWMECNASQIIAQRGKEKRVAVIGHFPFVDDLRKKVGHLDVLELNPLEGDLPASAAPEVIPLADVVAITGMTLINGTLEGLLNLCKPEAFVILLGPSTLLSPVLFEYGVDLLGGAVVEKIEPVMNAVDEGKLFHEIFPLGVRMVIFPSEKSMNN